MNWRSPRPPITSTLPVLPILAGVLPVPGPFTVPPVLVGSSMGAFVSGLASLERPVAGLFLMATPESIPGCEVDFDVSPDVPTVLIHGWRDELCPLDDIYAFAERRQLPLLVLDDDHRLSASVDAIAGQFGLFLESLAARA